MKKNHKNLLLNIVFIIGILMSYYNVLCSDFSTFAIDPKIECSAESASFSSDYDFSEDDHFNPTINLYFLFSNCIRKTEYEDTNLFIEAPLAHWQPPKA
jgi:hypothetical protein